LLVTARCQNKGVEVMVEDNGVGLEQPNGDRRDNDSGGSGGGLALHSTMMAVVGGTLSMESVPGDYTRVMLTLPLDGERQK
jgi:signal transduction histidine kinase